MVSTSYHPAVIADSLPIVTSHIPHDAELAPAPYTLAEIPWENFFSQGGLEPGAFGSTEPRHDASTYINAALEKQMILWILQEAPKNISYKVGVYDFIFSKLVTIHVRIFFFPIVILV